MTYKLSPPLRHPRPTRHHKLFSPSRRPIRRRSSPRRARRGLRRRPRRSLARSSPTTNRTTSIRITWSTDFLLGDNRTLPLPHLSPSRRRSERGYYRRTGMTTVRGRRRRGDTFRWFRPARHRSPPAAAASVGRQQLRRVHWTERGRRGRSGARAGDGGFQSTVVRRIARLPKVGKFDCRCLGDQPVCPLWIMGITS